MSRMRKQAAANREAASKLRDRGNDKAAEALEARATALESGRVTDNTDTATGFVKWALRG